MVNRKFNKNPFAAFDNSQISDKRLNSGEGISYIPLGAVKKATSFFKRQEALNFSVLPKLKIKIWYFVVVILAIVAIFFGRLVWLQLYEASNLGVLAEGNRIRNKIILSQRGVISDRNDIVLVRNIPIFSVALIPVDLPTEKQERQKLFQELSRLANLRVSDVEGELDGVAPYSYEPVTLGDPISYDQALRLAMLEEQFTGVQLSVTSGREYLHNNAISLSHVLGYLGKISADEATDYLAAGYQFNELVGKVGLEFRYEGLLKGTNGIRQVETDALGSEQVVISEQKPVDGKNLVLTLDTELQSVAENSLRQVLTKTGPQAGSVVVMDPNSGEILALVSWPAFNSNDFATGINQDKLSSLIADDSRPLFNRAVSGQYPSGSTFKMVVAAGALEEGVITPQSTFYSRGGIAVDRWFFPDWKAGGHGATNLSKALAESVNTYFYIIGGGYEDRQGLGIEKLNYYAQLFGLTQTTGIDLPNEAEGFFPSIAWKESVKQERWYIGDTYNTAIGQGDVLVTPLQVANWTSVFANGGVLYRPHLVKQIKDNTGEVIKEVAPEPLNSNFIAPGNIAAVRTGLRRAVTSGSSVAMNALPISSAGKTGTAQWSSTKPDHAWFTSFAPYEDPQIVVTVMVEEGVGGNTTALPVARQIIQWWANNRLTVNN